MLRNSQTKRSPDWQANHLQSGFNLIELMVVLFVGSILLGVGVPAMTEFMANNRMSTSVNDLNLSVHLARSEAIKQRANITVCASTNSNSAAPRCNASANISDGWIVFVDSLPPAAANLTPLSDDDILYTHGPMDDSIDVVVADTNNTLNGVQFMSFSSTGFPVTQVAWARSSFNFQLCDTRGDIDVGGGIAAGRWLQVTPTGRPQIYREKTAIEGSGNPTNGCS